MSPFGFGKKKEEATIHACCCGSAAEGTVTPCCAGSVTSVKVMGAGSKACHTQYENAKAAVQALGLNVEVEYITDMEKVMAYGVMSMPVIVINEQVAASGRVLKPAEVEKLLRGTGA